MSGDSEDRIEGIRLRSRLRGLRVCSGCCRLAGVLRGLVGAAAVRERVTYELRDNVNVLRGTVVK